MSITYLNHFLVENMSLTAFPIIFLVLSFLEFFFFNISLKKISKFFSRSHSSLQYQLLNLLDDSNFQVKKESLDFDSSQTQPSFNDEGSLRREEVEMVMGKLGLFCHSEGENLQERFGSEEIYKLFEEREPSLDEVKGAFDVFDENRDGFIDARELQRVLSALGLKKESETENCKKMIMVFDESGDGRIDFDEFVKLMESSFC